MPQERRWQRLACCRSILSQRLFWFWLRRLFWCCLCFVWSCVYSLRGFFRVCLVRCLIVVFSGSRATVWLPYWGRKSWLVSFSVVCGLPTVCLALFALSFGVIGRLCSSIVAHLGHLLLSDYFCKFPISRRWRFTWCIIWGLYTTLICLSDHLVKVVTWTTVGIF